jgi:hypothetical protein
MKQDPDARSLQLVESQAMAQLQLQLQDAKEALSKVEVYSFCCFNKKYGKP